MRAEQSRQLSGRRAATCCTSTACVVFLVTVVVVTAATLTSSAVPVYPSALIRLDRFGFEAGGKFSLFATMKDSAEVILNVCTTEQYNGLLNRHSTLDSICAVNATQTCMFSGHVSAANSVSTHRTVDEATTVEVFYINCHGNSGYMEYEFDPLNPGGEHLSTTEVPLKSASVLAALCVGGVGVLWALHVLSKHRVAQLHLWLCAALTCLLVYDLVAVEYWHRQSSTGDAGVTLVAARLFADVAAHSAVMVTFMLVVNGYSLLVQRLDAATWRSISAMATVYGLAIFAFAIFRSLFFLLLLLLVDAFVVRYVTSTARQAMSHLELQTDRASALGIDLEMTPMAAQKRVFGLTKSLCMGYILADVVLRLVEVLALQDKPWVAFAIDQSLLLSVLVVLAVLLRVGPRPVDIFFPIPWWWPLLGRRSRRDATVSAEDEEACTPHVARYMFVRYPNDELSLAILPDPATRGRARTRSTDSDASRSTPGGERERTGAGPWSRAASAYSSAGSAPASQRVTSEGPVQTPAAASSSGDHYIRLAQ